jgi:hypothetical protein
MGCIPDLLLLIPNLISAYLTGYSQIDRGQFPLFAHPEDSTELLNAIFQVHSHPRPGSFQGKPYTDRLFNISCAPVPWPGIKALERAFSNFQALQMKH